MQKARKIKKCKCGRVIRGISSKCSYCQLAKKKERNLKIKFKRNQSPSRLKKQCDILFSKIIRLRDGKCLKCDSTKNLQNAHLINRSNLAYRWDEKSAICLCYKCHLVWCHLHPLEFSDWLQVAYPEKYKYWKENWKILLVESFSYSDIKLKLETRLKELL